MVLSHSWLPSAGKMDRSETGKSNPPQKGYILAVSSYLLINPLHVTISCDKDGTDFFSKSPRSLSVPISTFLLNQRGCPLSQKCTSVIHS